MRFIKYDGRPFEVGMTIRLGGRVGYLHSEHNNSPHGYFIRWQDRCEYAAPITAVAIDCFPDLEIGIEEPKISQEACAHLSRWIDDHVSHCAFIHVDGHELKRKLSSMVQPQD